MRVLSHLLKMTGAAVLATAVATPVLATETAQEQANKKVVLDFYAALDNADATHSMHKNAKSILEKYLGPDYTQHAEMFKNLPGPGTDRDKLERMFESQPDMKNPPPKGIDDAVMAEGDLVMYLRHRDMTDPATGKTKSIYIFNMFRVRNGKLVEHWDVSPSMSGSPPAGSPSLPGAKMPGSPPPGSGAPPAGAPPGPPPGKN